MIWIKKGKVIGNNGSSNTTKSKMLKTLVISTIIGNGLLVLNKPVNNLEPIPSPSTIYSPISIPQPKKSHYKPYKPRVSVEPTIKTGPDYIQTPSPSPQNFVDPIPRTERKILVIQHETLLSKLSRNHVSDGEIKYNDGRITFDAKYNIGPFSVPFHIVSNFRKDGTDLGMSIKELQIKGENETGKRLQELQERTKSMFKVNNANNTEYELNIEHNGKIVYKQQL